MSNYLAIATVTVTLKQIVAQAFQAVPKLSAAPEVRTGRPENQEPAFVGANLYLYQVMPNASLRNEDLVTRRADGTLVQRPQLALDLYYLLTFYGKEAQQEPQRLMGSTVTALHAQPILTREQIRDAISTAGAESYLSASDLDQQAVSVKFSPIILNLEELSKLWTVFFQVTHALSVAYQASVVLLEADLSVQRALPARTVAVSATPQGTPTIRQVVPDLVDAENAEVILQGENLIAEGVRVRFGNLEVPAQSHANGDLSARLPAGLRAGVNSVQVLQPLPPEITTTPNSVLESNQQTFILQPRISDSVQFSTVRDPRTEDLIHIITVKVMPAIGPYQKIELLLNEWHASLATARGYSFASALRFNIDPAVQTELDQQGSSELSTAFAGHSIFLSTNLAVTVNVPGKRWVVEDFDNRQIYWIEQNQDRLVIYFCVAGSDPISSIAFQIPYEGRGENLSANVTSGTYLVRVQVDGLQYAESRLSLDGQTGEYIAPRVEIP